MTCDIKNTWLLSSSLGATPNTSWRNTAKFALRSFFVPAVLYLHYYLKNNNYVKRRDNNFEIVFEMIRYVCVNVFQDNSLSVSKREQSVEKVRKKGRLFVVYVVFFKYTV